MDPARLTGSRIISLLMVCALWLASAGCTSRFAAALYLTEGPSSERVKIREVFYVKGFGVSSAFSADYLVRSDGALAAIAFFTRDSATINPGTGSVVEFRAHNEYRLIAPLPAAPAVGPLPLSNRVFIKRLSFEQTEEVSRTYLFSSGEATIDSTKKSDLFTTISAVFRNQDGDSLSISGRAMFKKRDNFAFKHTRYVRDR
ncbi:MAG: hypothetical protein ACE5GA_08105 [Candidatus Zixiibacteriota bacterium]